jgi:hypothetical protein
MRPALDAVVINNDHLLADDVVARIERLLAERPNPPAPFPLTREGGDGGSASEA